MEDEERHGHEASATRSEVERCGTAPEPSGHGTTPQGPDDLITLREAAAIAGLQLNTLKAQASRKRPDGTTPLRTVKRGTDRFLTRRWLHEYLLDKSMAVGGRAKPLPDDYQTPQGEQPIKGRG